MYKVRRPISGRIAFISAIAFHAACGHASTTSRIDRLGKQEAELRESVQALETRQRTLRVEVERAQRDAERARCQASVEGYRAVVATTFAEYSVKVAEHKGCKAQAAKGGGVVAAVGCGIAAFMTGGVALALCGGALVGGAMMSESCDDAPPVMSAEDIRLIAQEKTGLPREPTCNATAYAVLGGETTRQRSLASPYGVGTGRVEASREWTAQGPTADTPTRKDRRALRKAEKQRRAQEKRQKRRGKQADAALDW